MTDYFGWFKWENVCVWLNQFPTLKESKVGREQVICPLLNRFVIYADKTYPKITRDREAYKP